LQIGNELFLGYFCCADMENINQYGVLILAAGKSHRMGMPKMLLPFDKNRSFLDVIVEGYRNIGCKRIVVVVNERDRPLLDKYVEGAEYKVVVNSYPERQRFFSIRLGMAALKSMDAVFLHNVDNPFVDRKLLLNMQKELREDEYVVPVFKGKGGHPILLSNNIVHLIAHYPDSSINFKKFLSEFTRTDVATGNKQILININTAEQYRDLGFEESLDVGRMPMNRE